MKTVSMIAMLAPLVGLVAAGCGKAGAPDKAPAKRPAAPVHVVKALKRDVTRSATYTGSVEPTRLARLASPAEGPIVACPVREGDVVQAGQVLARVGRSRMADTALEAAREERSRLAAEFTRVERLVGSGALPGEQVEAARANLKRADAQLAAMETGRGDYEIAAPWPGVVSKVWIAEGHYVAPRTPLLELFDPASLVARFSVPERDLPAVHTGMLAQVRLDAYPGRVIPAEIVRIYPGLDMATRTATVEAECREEVRLWQGLFARVAVPLRTARGAVAAPDSALIVMPDGEAVVFVAEGGKAVRRPVRIALEGDGWLAVESGLEAGDSVLVRGHESLRDGAPVQVMEPAGRPGPGAGGKGTAGP